MCVWINMKKRFMLEDNEKKFINFYMWMDNLNPVPPTLQNFLIVLIKI